MLFLIPILVLVQVATSSVCKRDCSGHGRCVEFECFCDVGFHGEDCGTALVDATADHLPVLSVGDFNLTYSHFKTLTRSKSKARVKSEAKNTSNTPIALAFSAPSCLKCVRFETEYLQLAPFLRQHGISLARVDMDTQKRLCRTLHVTTPPSFGILFSGRKRLNKPFVAYSGIHQAPKLREFIDKLVLQPPLRQLDSVQQVQRFVALDASKSSAAVFCVGFFANPRDVEEELPELLEAAQTLQSNERVFMAAVTDNQVTQAFLTSNEFHGVRHLSSSTSVLVLWRNDPRAHAFPLARRLTEAIAVGHQELSIAEWVIRNSVAVVDELTPENFPAYAALQHPMLLLFLDLPATSASSLELSSLASSSETEPLITAFTNVALRYQEEIKFVYANGNRFSDRMRNLGLFRGSAVLPAMALNVRAPSHGLSPDSVKTWAFPYDHKLDERGISIFCHDFLTGRYAKYSKPSVNSIPIHGLLEQQTKRSSVSPQKGVRELFDDESREANAIIGVKTLEEFDSLTRDPTRDVVICFHSALYCEDCLILAPFLKRVARRFRELSISSLLFLHVNVDEVVPPAGYVVHRLPTLVLLPSVSKEPPFPYYSGVGQVLPIMKWIEQHSGIKFSLPRLAQFDADDRELYEQQIQRHRAPEEL